MNDPADSVLTDVEATGPTQNHKKSVSRTVRCGEPGRNLSRIKLLTSARSAETILPALRPRDLR